MPRLQQRVQGPGIPGPLRRLLPVLLALAVCVGSALGSRPARALFAYAGVCTVTITLTWDHPVTAAAREVSLGNPGGLVGWGSCTGTRSSTVQFSGTGTAIVSCTTLQMLQVDLGLYLSAFGSTRATLDAAGATPAQLWTLIGRYGSPPSVIAAGSVVWANSGQLQQCQQAGITKMTLTGYFVVEDPRLT